MAHVLTVAYRRQLIGLQAVMLRDLRSLWPLFDPDKPSTWGSFLTPATALVQTHHGAAVALGARYYARLREAQHPYLPANDVTLPPVTLDTTKLTAALAATGLAGTYGALRAGKPLAAALDNGFVRAGMSAGRAVLNGGRDAVLAAARGDSASRGYVRVTDGNGCAWCTSLAGERTAPDTFQAHDGCGCTAEPVWA